MAWHVVRRPSEFGMGMALPYDPLRWATGYEVRSGGERLSFELRIPVRIDNAGPRVL